MKQLINLIALMLSAGAIAMAQQKPSGSSAPFPLKGTAPPAKPSVVPPLIEKVDFGGQLRILEGGVDDAGKRAVSATPVESATPTVAKPVPKDYRPKMDVPLNSTALEAVRVSEEWREEKVSHTADPDGRVVYAYGAGLPTVVCAPLRICMIELQPGERILGEPHIGDSVRWHISPSIYGSGERATSVIVLKPQVPGLDTNLLITTDRRAYYIRLISKAEEYVARAAFEYPEYESNRRWQEHAVEQQALARQAQHAAEGLPAMITVEQMHFDYRIKGGDDPLRPVRVFDDGSKTFIQMPPEIAHREAPVLVVIGTDGKGEMTNYRVKNQTYIIDRLFDRANLVLGSGKKAQKVEITRGTKG